MEYIVLRYRQRPDAVVNVAATNRADEAVALALRWSDRAPDEGVIVAIAEQPIVHCAPQGR